MLVKRELLRYNAGNDLSESVCDKNQLTFSIFLSLCHYRRLGYMVKSINHFLFCAQQYECWFSLCTLVKYVYIILQQ